MKQTAKNINDVMISEIWQTYVIIFTSILLVVALAIIFHPIWLILLFMVKAKYDTEIKEKWLKQK